jgi:hypothetical protein
VGGCPIRKRVLCEKDFGWIAFWGLNPEVLWSLWLMASATCGEITSAEGLHDWGRRAVTLLNYTLAFALKLRKSTENLSQGSRVVGDYSLRRLGWLLMDSLGWSAEHQSASVTRGWLDLAPTALGLHTRGDSQRRCWDIPLISRIIETGRDVSSVVSTDRAVLPCL